jgi:PKD repeat protein
MIKKIAFAGVGLAMLASPLLVSAQTVDGSSNASLMAVLTQLIQILEQELQQLISAQGSSPSTQPQPVPQPTTVPQPQPVPQPTTNSSFSASPTSGTAPLSLAFRIQNVPDLVTQYSINFGDGSSCTGGSASCDGVTHTYAAAGTYTATLSRNFGCDSATVSNPCGPIASINITVTTTHPPATSFTASPTSGQAPLPVTFSSSYGNPTEMAQGPDGTQVQEQLVGGASYAIDFGDGSQLHDPQCPPSKEIANGMCSVPIVVQHTYATAGTYTATLKQFPASTPIPVGAERNPPTVISSQSITVTGSGTTGNNQSSATIDQAAGTVTAASSGDAAGDLTIPPFSGGAQGTSAVNVVVRDGSYAGPTDFSHAACAGSSMGSSLCPNGTPWGIGFTNIAVSNGRWTSGNMLFQLQYPIPSVVTVLVYDATILNGGMQTPLAETTVNVVPPVPTTPSPGS